MNSFSMVSRVFVVTAIVFAGNVFGSQAEDLTNTGSVSGQPGMFTTCGKAAVNAGYAKLNTAAAVIVAQQLPKNADAAKSVVETVGLVLDNGKKISKGELASNFVINYTARKAGHALADYGYTVDNTVGKVVGMVPFVGEAASPVVTEVVKAAGPQTVASIILYALAQYATSGSRIE